MYRLDGEMEQWLSGPTPRLKFSRGAPLSASHRARWLSTPHVSRCRLLADHAAHVAAPWWASGALNLRGVGRDVGGGRGG